MSAGSLLRNVAAFLRSGHKPSPRAWAALAKLHGRRLERRWPFLPKAAGGDLNLGFDDVLEFEFARNARVSVLVIGAYDGVENDPVANFIRTHDCEVTFVEPQPAAFARLRANMAGVAKCSFINAAIHRTTGSREMFYVPEGLPGLPEWVGQLASFDREHIAKHEARASGVSANIAAQAVETISFTDLIDRQALPSIDILQVDAEGMDAALLSWFPFDRMRPGVVHYEVSHMTTAELEQTRNTLRLHGYGLIPDHLDEIAILR